MSTEKYVEPDHQADADEFLEQELRKVPPPEDPEKAAARERKLALIEERKVLREKEKARRAVILSEARARAEQALAAADEELADDVEQAVKTIIAERDIAREWAVLDKLQPQVGDAVTVNWSGEARKGVIEEIDDHAGDPDQREWRPLLTIRLRGMKRGKTYRPSSILSITKVVIP